MDLIALSYYIAPLIGLITLIIGVSAVLRPQRMADKFGIAATAAALPYVVATGIRDVFMGLTVLVLYYLSEWQALGAIILCITVVAISDYRNVQKHGDKKTSNVHLIGAIAVALYGSWILLSFQS